MMTGNRPCWSPGVAGRPDGPFTEWHFPHRASCLNGVGWNFLFVGAHDPAHHEPTGRPSAARPRPSTTSWCSGPPRPPALMASVVLELKGWAAPQLRGAGPGVRGLPGDRPVPICAHPSRALSQVFEAMGPFSLSAIAATGLRGKEAFCHFSAPPRAGGRSSTSASARLRNAVKNNRLEKNV